MVPRRAWPSSSRSSCHGRARGRTSSTSPSTPGSGATSFISSSSARATCRNRRWRKARPAGIPSSPHAERRHHHMDRAAALQKIRQAREAKGLSYDDLGRAIGTKDTMYIAAALHGQHRLNAEEAKQLAQALGIDADTAMATTAMPLRTDFPLTTDPFKYRLMELVGVYGDALRERSNELFGDGILSAIDCVVKLEKKGERGVLTIDAKFLHYKEY